VLDELSLNNDVWLKMAYDICKNKELSKDLVQDMYIKLHKSTQKISAGYVRYTIRSIFIDQTRKDKGLTLVDIETYPKELEYPDYDFNKDIEAQNKIDKINNAYKELNDIQYIIVSNSFTDGLRKFSRESKIPVSTVSRYRNKFKEKLNGEE